jgi:hypothetical protein
VRGFQSVDIMALFACNLYVTTTLSSLNITLWEKHQNEGLEFDGLRHMWKLSQLIDDIFQYRQVPYTI